ncbi:MAG: 50S ribosomal protein L24 [Patescibacteria group bacterium]|jgi:large subunit ribosomal protein L24|nr:50S ribosomal protein L24 [Patescibacteria group bacterium]
MKIKANDKVKILRGKDKGKTGKVIQIFSSENKIVVEGINIMKKHMRARKQGEKGQVIELSAPMDASKAMVICQKCGRAVRINRKLEAGKKKRVCNKCKEFID